MEPVALIEPTVRGVAVTNLWEQVVLPLRARHDVLVSLANSGPVIARRHVVAIHDTAHWDHPEWFSLPYRIKARSLNRSWARTASHLLCPSETVATNISRWLGRDAADITVVGNGHRWRGPMPEPAHERRPFVLAVGTISTRKNLGALLAAWPMVRRERPELTLRIIGADGGHNFAGSAHRVDDPSIEYLGYVSDAALDQLIVEATSFVSPSLYEGFNIPILDALTAGTPVAASDIDVHRELFDGACSFADPTDPTALAASVLDASAATVAPATRDELRRTHSWAMVAHRIESALEGVRRGT
ncbi:glycosyltransferase family 4 protein [Ilumatobacter sp.]|uniref:glycosyltransferase family 4 protein n=1 Tax=Ilumatobacter sp. TaxID=1967498 RepID=UPI003AF64DE1